MARTHAHVRDALQRERSQLLQDLARDDRPDAGCTSDVADVATTRIEQLTVDRDRQRRQDRVTQIEAALLRLDEGSYGQCEHCGGRIAFERLEALPTATACVSCAASVR